MNEKKEPELTISSVEFSALCRKIAKLEESIERMDNQIYFMNIELNKYEMKNFFKNSYIR